MWTLRYQDGTITADGAAVGDLPPGYVHDDRVGCPRGPGCLYAETVRTAKRAGIEVRDEARAWAPLDDLAPLAPREPRLYQKEAADAWVAAGKRGLVVLPTGSGKTLVAELAITATRRPTLVVAPTLDLVGQWHARLSNAYGRRVGILGGGHHELEALTVSTYDSAYIHLGRYGDRFGLLVFDEVHHLPAPGYLRAAECALAPFRLGLTATLEREDGREADLFDLVGPVVYRREITDLAGDYLAAYETVRVEVWLRPDEQARYDDARRVYGAFVSKHRIRVAAPGGWNEFIREASRSPEGREAFQAYLESKRIQHGTEQKLDLLGEILEEEWGRPTLVFTHDNATAYRVSREFLVPCVSHLTDVAERREILDAFEKGELPVVVTSRVLNEGVDLPAAEVAVVLSGSGTVREHVQRLGRILRPGHGKRAVLYEVVAAGTSEVHTSKRRRSHDAYR